MSDERFMARALELARAAAFTSPNPRVGAVIVRDGEVLAEGTHMGAGRPHAEAVAIGSTDIRGSTCYVTLEPCMHHGRTPPCAPALAGAGVESVVVAIEDPDPRVAGRGIEYLRSHGVDVVTGVLADEARALNVAYLHHRRTGRPLLTVKLALSLDGKIAARDRSSFWITGPQSRRFVHERRHEVDAVLVGAGTVVADDPWLTVRDVPASRQPTRIVVDSSGRVPAAAHVFAPGAEVIVATTVRAPEEQILAWKDAGAEVVVLGGAGGRVDLDGVIRMMGERGCLEVMCEGGAELATALVKGNLADRLELFSGAVVIGEGVGLGDIGVSTLSEAPRFELVSTGRLGSDVRSLYERPGT